MSINHSKKKNKRITLQVMFAQNVIIIIIKYS